MPSLQCLEAAARERERKDGRKGRKSLVLFVCLFVCLLLFFFCRSERIWFSNGDVCYVEAEEWFHEPGKIFEGKNSTRAEGIWSGKKKNREDGGDSS